MQRPKLLSSLRYDEQNLLNEQVDRKLEYNWAVYFVL